ncbi:unnamed protein product [Adineta steineri]|uniref:Uncharacterized protein n=1 Tax=Adineta steineri TaxID=433720 RepID=A0A813XKS1_9BILA|nr:unnamed protein product [Adineta steineri]
MAKTSKIEDYWRQNNIENLLKDLTHVLAQKMPSDPAVALVQHLQKKFPKSFTTTTDNNIIDPVSKITTTTLRSQSIMSPRSDINITNTSNIQMDRRESNQSQVSGIVTIPTIGSAFNNLTDSSRQEPEINLRNLVLTSRLGQHVIKYGKDIRSENDILEDELLKPQKLNTNVPSTTTTNPYSHLATENLQNIQTHEEPSVEQLVRYKQKIRFENDRGVQHREKLAELAQKAYDRERILQPEELPSPSEIQQQEQNSSDDHTASKSSDIKSIHKPVVKSKEEEDILNDENVFHPRKQRQRERDNDKLKIIRSNALTTQRQSIIDLNLSRRIDENMLTTMRFGVCKVCGNILSNEELDNYTQQVAAEPVGRSVNPNETVVDDWFQSSADSNESKPLISPITYDQTSSSLSSNINPFQEKYFQSIQNNNVQHLPPSVPTISINNGKRIQRSSTPRSAESDVFIRTPSPQLHLSSLQPQNVPSKTHQTDSLAVTNHQLFKPIPNLPATPSISASPLITD